jgi:hypothetical protein
MFGQYTVIYINIDEFEYSEVIGTYNDLHHAVEAMITAAHYDEVEGVLRQYRLPSDDYPSYQNLYDIAYENLQIIDYDIYKIIQSMPVQ